MTSRLSGLLVLLRSGLAASGALRAALTLARATLTLTGLVRLTARLVLRARLVALLTLLTALVVAILVFKIAHDSLLVTGTGRIARRHRQCRKRAGIAIAKSLAGRLLRCFLGGAKCTVNTPAVIVPRRPRNSRARSTAARNAPSRATRARPGRPRNAAAAIPTARRSSRRDRGNFRCAPSG